MWTFFLVLSLIVGLSALGWGLTVDIKGWDSLGGFATFLLAWLPAVSILTIVILCAVAARSGWRWTFVAGILVLLAGVQFGSLFLTGGGRWTICFLPAVLVCLSTAVLFRRNWSVPLGLQQAGPLFAWLGLIAIAGAFGLRAVERRRQDRAIEAYRVQQAKKDATARGLERAAWLLSSEFTSLDGYSEAEVVRAKVFVAPRSGGEYRWDGARRRLLVTRGLFGELSSVRDRILPRAAAALQSDALRPGPRPAFGGGVLACRPPLDCDITWEFDVDGLHPAARPSAGP
jgi:hypothetical protein